MYVYVDTLQPYDKHVGVNAHSFNTRSPLLMLTGELCSLRVLVVGISERIRTATPHTHNFGSSLSIKHRKQLFSLFCLVRRRSFVERRRLRVNVE